MNITASLDNGDQLLIERPGEQLAMIRISKGFSMEYIAEKLHLRVQLLESLENDEYSRLPEPVFIKGYLRAYARLMEVMPEPFIQAFLSLSNEDPCIDKPMWKATKLPKQKGRYRRWILFPFIILIVFILMFVWKKSGHDATELNLQNAQDVLSQDVDKAGVKTTLTELPQVDTMKSLFKQSVEVGSKNL